jgi:hypothetical protein
MSVLSTFFGSSPRLRPNSKEGQVMKMAIGVVLAVALTTALTTAATAGEGMEIKILETPLDPGQETVLVGRSLIKDMVIQLELEPAKPMRMASTATVQLELNGSSGKWEVLTTPATWGDHSLREGELYHVEVKPIDPKSKTRIPYAHITFQAVNIDNKQTVHGNLHPMWGGSGLHYALNSGLAGDGTYQAEVTVGVPTFARSTENSRWWMEPRTAKFHFKLVGGKLTEVSEPR